MCACKHVQCYIYIIERIEVADETITSKNPDLKRFIILKPRHAGRLKNQFCVEKPRKGNLGYMRLNAYYRNLK